MASTQERSRKIHGLVPGSPPMEDAAKAAQLAAEIGMPLALTGAPAAMIGADALDSLAILRATQTLSTERNTSRLRDRVEAVVGKIAGATKVLLALWEEEARNWAFPAGDGQPLAAFADGITQLVPVSALSYAKLTGKPLFLADALADDRFARDPYFRGTERCEVLVVPILSLGTVQAMLFLENRSGRSSFSVPRQDAVMAIAAQLSLALDNAQQFQRLERQIIEQADQLHDAQLQLQAEARRSGMAQIATNVLHNVGNVLTSVNVSAHVLTTHVRHSPASRVGDLAQLLTDQADQLETFFSAGGKGLLLPAYLRDLAGALATEREQLLGELERLCSSVDHIKNVIAMQQSYAGSSRLLEAARITDVVDDALRIQEASLSRHSVQVQRDYAPVEIAPLDKTRVMQILVNLLENARHAMDEVVGERRMKIVVRQEAGCLIVSVGDCGCGISADNLQRIFSHGFTTRLGGHGFGLHSCAVAAQELGGTLSAHSQGHGTGATFVLRLPALAALAAL
ncbi:MAG: GAF domain-containing protein [Polaromonas sp.]|nr:GAF domain-containing protein [Polaromonas sp.]